jgi:hypothetical protein
MQVDSGRVRDAECDSVRRLWAPYNGSSDAVNALAPAFPSSVSPPLRSMIF